MLQQCNHPNVVRYLGSHQGEDYLWVRKPDLDFTLFSSVAILRTCRGDNVAEKSLSSLRGCRKQCVDSSLAEKVSFWLRISHMKVS